MKTNLKGASVNFTFYGTAVEVFGAARPNHGNFKAGIDGSLQEYPGGSSGDHWQEVLFTQSNLPLGEHTVQLVNADEDRFLDIDHVRSFLPFCGARR